MLAYLASVVCFVSAFILFILSVFEIYSRWTATSEDIIFLVIPFALSLAIVGGFFAHCARRKSCPQCGNKCQYKVICCKKCGHQFPEQTSRGLYKPFYE
jgi:hypothetical protein